MRLLETIMSENQMLGKGKPQHRYWPPGAGTVALALLVLFALLANPAQAGRGVAVDPYWQLEVEGHLTALAVDDLDGECEAYPSGCGWAEIITGTDEGRVTLWHTEGDAAWTFDVETDWVTDLDGECEAYPSGCGAETWRRRSSPTCVT